MGRPDLLALEVRLKQSLKMDYLPRELSHR